MKKLINSCVCVTRWMAVSDAGVCRFGPAKFLILTILPQGAGPVHALLRKPLDIGCGTHTSLGLKSLDYHILKKKVRAARTSPTGRMHTFTRICAVTICELYRSLVVFQYTHLPLLLLCYNFISARLSHQKFRLRRIRFYFLPEPIYMSFQRMCGHTGIIPPDFM